MDKLNKLAHRDLLLSVLKKKIRLCQESCGEPGTRVVFLDNDATNWVKANLKLVCDNCYYKYLKAEDKEQHPKPTTGYISAAKEPRAKHKRLIRTASKDSLGITSELSQSAGQNVEVADTIVSDGTGIVKKDKKGNVIGFFSQID